MNNRIIKLLYLFGIVFVIVGSSLFTIHFTNYDYSRRKTQCAEFWAVVRTGGRKLTQQDQPTYVFDIPLSSRISDLRVFHLSFNISTQTDTSFWVPKQMISALSDPGFSIFASDFLNNSDMNDDEYRNYIWENFAIEF